MNRTHYLIYYVNSSDAYVISTPKNWAAVNRQHFTKPDPITEDIEKYLIENYNFQKQETERTVVLYNYAMNITSHNNIPFNN